MHHPTPLCLQRRRGEADGPLPPGASKDQDCWRMGWGGEDHFPILLCGNFCSANIFPCGVPVWGGVLVSPSPLPKGPPPTPLGELNAPSPQKLHPAKPHGLVGWRIYRIAIEGPKPRCCTFADVSDFNSQDSKLACWELKSGGGAGRKEGDWLGILGAGVHHFQSTRTIQLWSSLRSLFGLRVFFRGVRYWGFPHGSQPGLTLCTPKVEIYFPRHLIQLL